MSNRRFDTPPGQPDKVVQVDNLSKRYGQKVAVNGTSFDLTNDVSGRKVLAKGVHA